MFTLAKINSRKVNHESAIRTISSQPRKRESSAPKPVTRPWIPACAGMTATERSENQNAIALPLKGGEGQKSKTAGNSPEMCPCHSPSPPPSARGPVGPLGAGEEEARVSNSPSPCKPEVCALMGEGREGVATSCH